MPLRATVIGAAGEIRAHSARQSRLDIVDVEQYEVAVDAIGHRPERPA
jgi:hypothetical protein